MSIRVLVPMRLVAASVLVAVVGTACGSSTPSQPAVATVTPSSSPSASPSLVPSTSPSASPLPTPTPVPTPVLVPAPLDGLMVSPAAARRHPIAVMIDDLSPARPQSGFSYASIVWQAPAEGGIPRYMLIFGENQPKAVGPIRSSRLYYIAWASEWKALYVHAGGSPQALTKLRGFGNGQLVYNSDEFDWEPYFNSISTRHAPHNL